MATVEYPQTAKAVGRRFDYLLGKVQHCSVTTAAESREQVVQLIDEAHNIGLPGELVLEMKRRYAHTLQPELHPLTEEELGGDED